LLETKENIKIESHPFYHIIFVGMKQKKIKMANSKKQIFSKSPISKRKNSLKTQKMHFLPVFELTSDSLSAIQVKPHQFP
jgi:hypothetical protein